MDIKINSNPPTLCLRTYRGEKKVAEASQSLSNIMSTLQLDEKYMQEAISLAQSHLEEAKGVD